MTGRAGASRTPRGFALLIVLWTMVLLTLIVSNVTATGRQQSRLALNVRQAAEAEAVADGAVNDAIYHVLDRSARHWAADGRARMLRFPNGTAGVRIESEAGKVNPNTASPELLQALLRETGADTRSAAAIAGAILDWRFPNAQQRAGGGGLAAAYRAAGRDYAPPHAPFQSLSELGLVLGMTPGLLARVTPHLTLYHDGDPDPASVDEVVARALGLRMRPPPGEDSPTVFSVTASATGPDGTSFTRRAVVRLGGEQGKLFEIVAWD